MSSHFPPPLHTMPMLSVEEAIKPSRESMNIIRVEIRLTGNPSAETIYKPRDIITGELVMFQTAGQKIIKDVYFNDVSIRFENKMKTSFNDVPMTMFSMTDSPTPDKLPAFAHDMKSPFDSCSFPFSFTIPDKHFDNRCVQGIEEHRNLLPSFGSPELNHIVFNPTDVAGAHKMVHSDSFGVLKHSEHTQFLNYYQISAQIAQNIDGRKKYVLFSRTMQIKVSGLKIDPVPTSVDNPLGLDSSNYYMVSDVNHSNELSVIKSMNVKDTKGDRMGAIMINSLLPEAIILDEVSKTSFPIDFKYLPKCSHLREFPEVTISMSLEQYVIQSKNCLSPIGNLVEFPEDYKLSSKTNNKVIYKKVQNIHKDVVKAELTWLPDYTNDKSYNGNYTVTIPCLHKLNELTVPTFHSCHLQNIYTMKLRFEVSMNTPDNVSCNSSKKSWTELVGFRRRSSESEDNSNTLKLNIPIVFT